MEAKSSGREGESLYSQEDSDHRGRELDELAQKKFTVKELVDGGVDKIPGIFTLPLEQQPNGSSSSYSMATHQPQVPVIDLRSVEGDRRREIVDEIRKASETWGMFQMINHGVPSNVINNLLESMRQFHEQPKETKVEFYTRDPCKQVQYSLSIHDAFKTALWKDSLICDFDNTSPNIVQLPLVCRKESLEYVKHMTELKEMLSELLSEALGLGSSHLKDIQCLETQKLVAHYAPACPEPELTMATAKHSDPYFFTMVLENNIDGIQVLHEDHWVDVMPAEGALVGIIGDMLQLVTNDLFKSAEHRGLAKPIGPRMSIGCFFHPSGVNKYRPYAPLKELISENKPPLYKETSLMEYLKSFWFNGTAGSKALSHFRL
ncbi:hypothetical protein Dimus_026526 [Dionaea muscipula]